MAVPSFVRQSCQTSAKTTRDLTRRHTDYLYDSLKVRPRSKIERRCVEYLTKISKSGRCLRMLVARWRVEPGSIAFDQDCLQVPNSRPVASPLDLDYTLPLSQGQSLNSLLLTGSSSHCSSSRASEDEEDDRQAEH